MIVFIVCSGSLHAGESSEDQRMRRFREAKLGVFIHRGIYGVDGVDESRSFYNGKISHEEYMSRLDGALSIHR